MIIAVHKLNYSEEQYYPKWVGKCVKTTISIRWINAKHTTELIREIVIDARWYTRAFKGLSLTAPYSNWLTTCSQVELESDTINLSKGWSSYGTLHLRDNRTDVYGMLYVYMLPRLWWQLSKGQRIKKTIWTFYHLALDSFKFAFEYC